MTGKRKIIDAHMHVWDIDRNYLPWLCDEEMLPGFRYGDYSALRRNYLLKDYRQDASDVEVCGTVFVETEWDPADPRGEIAWIKEVAAREGLPSVVVGQARLHTPNVAALLEDYGADAMVVGIRHKPAAAARPQDVVLNAPASMGDPKWREGYARLAPNGLSFDLQTPWWHLAEARALADDFGDTVIILNHTGLPADRSKEGLGAWREALKPFAAAPNTRIKISGIGVPGKPWDADANRGIVLDAIEIFGIERCMFASNFPVDSLVASYKAIFDGFEQICRNFAEAESDALFRGNAQRIYRIPQSALIA